MKVSIQNFQSIQNAILEVRGLTVLVGRSNIGKSAVVRAITGALENREGSTFVTEGETYCRVHLDVPAGPSRPALDVVWCKGVSHNDYTVNGTVLGSVGRGAPPEIAQAGFASLEIGRETLSVQTASQFSPLFLLDSSGAVAAEAISDVGRLSEVQDALRTCDQDRREAKALLKVRKKDLQDVNASYARFELWEAEQSSLETLQDKWLAIQASGAVVKQMVGLQEESTRYMKRLQACAPYLSLDIAEEPVALFKAVSEVKELSFLRHQLSEVQRQLKVSGPLTAVTLSAMPQSIETLSLEVQALELLQERVESAKALYLQSTAAQELQIPMPALGTLYDRVKLLQEWNRRLQQHGQAGKAAQLGMHSLGEDQKSLDAEIQALLDRSGVCPTCGKEVHHG